MHVTCLSQFSLEWWGTLSEGYASPTLHACRAASVRARTSHKHPVPAQIQPLLQISTRQFFPTTDIIVPTRIPGYSCF